MTENSVDHPTEEFDLVVLGSGEGSKFLAWTLAREGKRVVVVEQRWIGGSSPNIACLPSKTDERLRTSAEGVWANGEIAGSPQFTHVAFDDYRILRESLAGGQRTTTDRLVPFSLFTDPELARVGLSEREAQAKSIPYRLFKIPMASVLRTRTLSETRGFMKALVGEDDQILGFTAFGASGGEIMSAVQIAMLGHLPYTALRDAILAHPTLMEGLVVLFSSAPVWVRP